MRSSSRFAAAAMGWRNLRLRPGRTLLTLLGIALGVAAVLATEITNRNASATLDRLFERALGGAQLQVLPPGNKTSVPATALDSARRMPGVELAVPIVRASTVLPGALAEGQVSSSASGIVQVGKPLEAEGIDPALDPLLRVYTLVAGRLPQMGRYEALVPQAFAEQNDLKLGGRLELFTPRGAEALNVTGLLAAEGAGLSNGGDVVLVPVDVLQEIFELGDGYSAIGIRAEAAIGDDPHALADLRAALERRLGRSARVSYPAARADLIPRMASTYNLALSFFSAVTLFMGAFLIYNTFATTVLERTQEIGLLRALGMQRRQVMVLVLAEAGLLALLGTFLGLGGGLLLARGLMDLMRRFFEVEGSSLALTWAGVLKSVCAGWLATLLATLLPANQATRTQPMTALAARGLSGKRLPAAVWLCGLGLLAAGWLFLHLPESGPTRVLIAVRLGAFAVFLLGTVLSVPLAVTVLEPVTRRLAARAYGAVGALGARNLRRSVTRTMVTVASLTISLIMIIEVASLVFILKRDVSDWLDNALGADLLIRAPYPMRPPFVQTLENVPGVEAVSPTRVIPVQVAPSSLDRSGQQGDSLFFLAVEPAQFRRVGDKEFVAGQGDPEAAWQTLIGGGALFVSSVVAEEYGLAQGGHLTLLTHRGQVAFTVAGITTEFDRSGLMVTGTYADLRRYFGEIGADQFAVKVSAGADAEEVGRKIRGRYEAREGIQVQSAHTYKAGVMVFFNRLTALFNVLGLVGVIIGSMGLLNTMTMNVLERTRELGMLRALGSLRRQVVLMVLAEAAIVGLVSALYGIGFGYLLSRVLVTVANMLAGYDLQYAFSTRPYLVALLIALGVSQVATLAPARRAASVVITRALKEE